MLNVLQGRNMTEDKKSGEADIWWEAVKGFNRKSKYGDRAFEGWAIPGNLKFDFQMLMKRFKIMYDEGFFEDISENFFIHFLGISRVSAGLLYTTLQKELQLLTWVLFSYLRSGYQKLVQQVFESSPVVTQPLDNEGGHYC